MKKTTVACLALTAAAFLLAFYFYPLLPKRMASHWNAAGAVDGYASKEFALFSIPVLSLALLGLFLLLPRIDPLRRNYAAFQRYYDAFVVLLIAFLFYLFLLTLAWNFGVVFSMPLVLAPAFAALFYFVGVLLERAKRNWFVGIRTPWTLSSERVWVRTHALGAKLFKACGVAALLGVVFPDLAFVLVIAPVLAATAFSAAYSFFEFKKEEKLKKKKRKNGLKRKTTAEQALTLRRINASNKTTRRLP
ncbi:MAG: SdpI family protein [Candidatus Norongarragalinales archaeon]